MEIVVLLWSTGLFFFYHTNKGSNLILGQVDLDVLQGKVVAIDANIWLMKLLSVSPDGPFPSLFPFPFSFWSPLEFVLKSSFFL